jgi:hypothetical protein
VPQQETVQCKQIDPKADVTVSRAGVVLKRASWDIPPAMEQQNDAKKNKG